MSPSTLCVCACLIPSKTSVDAQIGTCDKTWIKMKLKNTKTCNHNHCCLRLLAIDPGAMVRNNYDPSKWVGWWTTRWPEGCTVSTSRLFALMCAKTLSRNKIAIRLLPFPTNTPRHTYVHLVKGVFFLLPAGEALFAVDWKVLTEHCRFIICPPRTVSYRPLTALEHRGELAGRTIYVCL